MRRGGGQEVGQLGSGEVKKSGREEVMELGSQGVKRSGSQEGRKENRCWRDGRWWVPPALHLNERLNFRHYL